MERFIYDWLYDYLTVHSPLNSSQHGFQHSQSCTTQLIEYLNDVTMSIDRRQCVDVIYLDFSKAFDKISHSLLITKLIRRNVPRQLIAWIASFLSNRRQLVVLGATLSDWAPVTSGVPQGSVLGPLLFNIFVDDLDNVLHQDVKIKKFADDTKLYVTYNADASAQAALKLQESLNAVQTWCNQWSMQLNVSKCTSMFFGCNNPHVTYMLNGSALTNASTMRDLGVTVSDNACVSQQCLAVSSKARRLTGLMLRTFSSRRRTVILPMLKAIIRPIVEYATPTWNPCLKKDIAEVEHVQRKVTKCIRGISHLSYDERLRSLDLPKLETRRLYFDMLECFKIVHNLTRSECQSVISLSELRTRGYHCRLKSALPPARTEIRKHFFLERALSQWNALPVEVVQQQTYSSFKLSLRKHLSV
jgi:ribonuclease P/MRP protein subunit RPP40